MGSLGNFAGEGNVEGRRHPEADNARSSRALDAVIDDPG